MRSRLSNDTLTFPARSTGEHLLLIYNYPGSGTLQDSTVTASFSRSALAGSETRGDGSNPPIGDEGPDGFCGDRDWLDSSDRFGDVNGDGRLDGDDLQTLIALIWAGSVGPTGDCNRDTIVDSADLTCVGSAIPFR